MLTKLPILTTAFYAHSTHYGIPGLRRLTLFSDANEDDVLEDVVRLRNVLDTWPRRTRILVYSHVGFGEDDGQEYYVFDKLVESSLLETFIEIDKIDFGKRGVKMLIDKGSYGEDENRTPLYWFTTTVSGLLTALNRPSMWNEDHDTRTSL